MLLRRIEVAELPRPPVAAVEFDPTTALIGENSAGKSTLLDAIAICCSGRDDRVRLEVRDFHQGGDEPPSETLRIALTFEETDGGVGEAGVGVVSSRSSAVGPDGRTDDSPRGRRHARSATERGGRALVVRGPRWRRRRSRRVCWPSGGG